MATEPLRPNAAGDENAIYAQHPADSFPPTDHWNKIDEEGADDDTTYVYMSTLAYQRDLYNLPAHSVGSGTINFIKIYFRFAMHYYTEYTAYAKPSQKSGDTITDGTEVSRVGPDYATYSQTYATNPATGEAYTWAEIDALQIGVLIKTSNTTGTVKCTQVYVEVDYTPAPAGFSHGHIIF